MVFNFERLVVKLQLVWPDVQIKSSPKVYKSWPKINHIRFYLISNAF